MAIQVVEPFTAAFNRMKWILFQPFDAAKWFALGFTAFLAGMGRGGGFSYQQGISNPTGGSGRPSGMPQRLSEALPPEASNILDWFRENLALVIVVGAILLVLGVAFFIVLVWLSSRGQFMFLDNIVHNRADVKRPWRLFREHGNRLFVFRIVLGLAFLALVLLIAGICFLITLPDIQAQQFGAHAIGGLAASFLLIFPLLLAMLLVGFVLGRFVIPTMYLRGIGVGEGFGVFRREILPGHLGVVVCFWLFNLALGLGAAMVIMLAGCCTCCIGFLPYLSSVLTLPVSVSLRSYSLYFLQQFGEDFRFFGDPAPVPPAPPSSPSPVSPLPPTSPQSPSSLSWDSAAPAPPASPDIFS